MFPGQPVYQQPIKRSERGGLGEDIDVWPLIQEDLSCESELKEDSRIDGICGWGDVMPALRRHCGSMRANLDGLLFRGTSPIVNSVLLCLVCLCVSLLCWCVGLLVYVVGVIVWVSWCVGVSLC